MDQHNLIIIYIAQEQAAIKYETYSHSEHRKYFQINDEKESTQCPFFSKVTFIKSNQDQHDEYNAVKYSQIFKKLQKSLQRDNCQEQPVAEPSFIIPGFEQVTIENRLWKFFTAKMQEVSSKVEKEKVNYCEKYFSQIRREVQNRKEANSKHLNSLEGIVKEKYKQIHSMFEEIERDKKGKFNIDIRKSKVNKKEILKMQDGDRILEIKDTINDLRKQIGKFEQQLQNIKKQQTKIEKEWLSFLRNMLKHEYYLKNGVTIILQEMVKSKYTPKGDDFPQILDEVSRQCLLNEYKNLQHIPITPFLNKDKQRNRILSQTKASMSGLIQNNLLRDVYHDTKQYMINWIKKSAWKQDGKPQSILPKIKKTFPYTQIDWRTDERRRLLHVYQNKGIYERVRHILFGWKVETVL